MSWEDTGGDGKCYTAADGCPETTAVTFLGFRTQITPCNAAWAVPGTALFGLIVAAAGLVVLKRR